MITQPTVLFWYENWNWQWRQRIARWLHTSINLCPTKTHCWLDMIVCTLPAVRRNRKCGPCLGWKKKSHDSADSLRTYSSLMGQEEGRSLVLWWNAVENQPSVRKIHTLYSIVFMYTVFIYWLTFILSILKGILLLSDKQWPGWKNNENVLAFNPQLTG